MPFDRLVKGIDAWAGSNLTEEVFAQIGDSDYIPQHMDWVRLTSPALFREKCQTAELMVSHAGIGSILLAIELQKPIIAMPRRAHLNEHRNDHQMATVSRLREKVGIEVIYDAASLDGAIRHTRASGGRLPGPTVASAELIKTIRDFINAES